MPLGIYPRKVRPVVIPVGPSIAYVELTKGQWSLIDSDDAERIGGFNWHGHWNRNAGFFYALRYHLRPDGKRGSRGLHSEVLNLPVGAIADHVSGSSLDNRKCNLRPATAYQNTLNHRMPNTNASGFKGVTRHSTGKWQASIKSDKRSFYLGLFHTPELAHEAYCSAANALHGEFRRTA